MRLWSLHLGCQVGVSRGFTCPVQGGHEGQSFLRVKKIPDACRLGFWKDAVLSNTDHLTENYKNMTLAISDWRVLPSTNGMSNKIITPSCSKEGGFGSVHKAWDAWLQPFSDGNLAPRRFRDAWYSTLRLLRYIFRWSDPFRPIETETATRAAPRIKVQPGPCAKEIQVVCPQRGCIQRSSITASTRAPAARGGGHGHPEKPLRSYNWTPHTARGPWYLVFECVNLIIV